MMALGSSAQTGARSGKADTDTDSPRIVNIINFIRQCEPRIEWITEDVLFATVAEQVAIMKKHRLKGTFLLQYDAGLRLKTAEGVEMKGGAPTVDDRTVGELTVRWPIDSPKGEIVITFNEASARISATGGVKGGWFFELSHDKKAVLPFRRIERKKLSCEFRNSLYSLAAAKGVFTNDPGTGLRIMPQDNQIVLDFSVR